MTTNILCPHCDCIVSRGHVLRCPQRDNNTAPHPTTLPTNRATVPGSLWVWQTKGGWTPGWVLWGMFAPSTTPEQPVPQIGTPPYLV